MTTVLHIDSSILNGNSVTRKLTTQIVEKLGADRVITRDTTDDLPFITHDWAVANGTPAADRNDAQNETLSLSDTLIAELNDADTIVIGAPIYNFNIPASLKAWIDQISRAGVTFSYTENGPKGLLDGKRAIVAVASGGTKVGSPVDHATPYLRHALGFVGITDVQFIAADALMVDQDAAMTAAKATIDTL